MTILTRKRAATLGASLGLLLAGPAAAADGASAGDTAWILTATALVLFMTLPGLALFYGGLVRARNLLSVEIQCFAIACLASLLWLGGGYGLAFGDGGGLNAWIGSLDKAFMLGVGPDDRVGNLPESLFFMFQMTFAIITPALMVGAYPERMKFSAVLLFSGLWLMLVYVPVTHWVWGGGWLAEMGVMDFAGGIVVHTTAGGSALVLAAMLGSRRGFPHEIRPPHSPGMTMAGAAMLWVGWFGFNAGSALAANGSAANAMMVTHISAAAASLTWMTIEWRKFGKPSLVGLVTGTIAGLATITPASGYVGPLGALVFGVAAGIACFYAVQLIKFKVRLDDSLDVFAVHGVGGMLGSLLTAVFALPALGGTGFAQGHGMAEQLLVQVIGVTAVLIFSGLVSLVLLALIKQATGLRASREEEVEGLDITVHGERAYEL